MNTSPTYVIDLESVISAARARAANDQNHGNSDANATDYIREDIALAFYERFGIILLQPEKVVAETTTGSARSAAEIAVAKVETMVQAEGIKDRIVEEYIALDPVTAALAAGEKAPS